MYYHAPLYRRLASDPRVDFTAIFASDAGIRPHDAGYGFPLTWAVDSLHGYRSAFLRRAGKTELGGTFFSLRDVDVVFRILDGRFEVLWLHGYNSLTHVLAASTQIARGGKILFREEQTLLHPRPHWKELIKQLAVRPLFARGAAVYIGNLNRRWFMHYGLTSDRLFFSPYVVDNDALRAQARRLRDHKFELRTSFGLQERDGPVILTVGRLIPKKQPRFLVRAFKDLREQVPCVLLVVGAGPLENELRRFVARERVPNVLFAGFLNQTEVVNAYACADIFALTSREHETWGLVVNEAMNFGLPVVTTDAVGCSPDLVIDGKTGFVVSRDDRAALTRSLKTLVETPELRRRFGRAGERRIQNWNVQQAADGVVAAVRSLVGPRRWASATEGPRLGE